MSVAILTRNIEKIQDIKETIVLSECSACGDSIIEGRHFRINRERFRFCNRCVRIASEELLKHEYERDLKEA